MPREAELHVFVQHARVPPDSNAAERSTCGPVSTRFTCLGPGSAARHLTEQMDSLYATLHMESPDPYCRTWDYLNAPTPATVGRLGDMGLGRAGTSQPLLAPSTSVAALADQSEARCALADGLLSDPRQESRLRRWPPARCEASLTARLDLCRIKPLLANLRQVDAHTYHADEADHDHMNHQVNVPRTVPWHFRHGELSHQEVAHMHPCHQDGDMQKTHEPRPSPK